MIEDEIRLGSRIVRYQVRRSDRAQRMRLRVIPGKGLEVVLPRGSTLREAATFVRRERDWVLRQLDALRVVGDADLAHGAQVPYLGSTLVVRLAGGASNRARRAGDVLHVTRREGSPAHAVVERWYRTEARRVLRERVLAHAATLGVEIGRIAVKDTRSRWGSCSSKGNLNFSWRLLLAPWEVLDYVVAHEVAHLKEMNHSPRFWAIVEQLCPDYRVHRAWLRTHGASLAAWPTAATDS
jgi:predicted metal-dependent hydrolase